MSEIVTHLNDLEAKINETWRLLDIPSQEKELADLETKMQAPDFWQDPKNAGNIGRRHEELRADIEMWKTLHAEVQTLQDTARSLQEVPDEEMATLIDMQTNELLTKYQTLEFQILMSGRHDKKGAIISVHAGSGGTEAQDWAEMLRRMLMRYAEKKGWQATLLDETIGEVAGIKSSTIRIQGRYAYGHLKSEHGTHRLVRISPFDAEGMRHTSFAGIDVIPDLDASDSVVIDPKELRIDTFMAGGKGGQSVNTTYSAVRIVHIPTGITVQCQNERSQLQNRETAMRILQGKLERLREEEEEKERQTLRGEYKSAEWGNQIRSYVLQPYKLVKDVRTKEESTDPETVLGGELDPFIMAYLRWVKEGRPDRS